MKLDPKTNKAEFLPVGFKIALLKKKRMLQMSQEQEDRLREKQKSLTPHFMIMAPRGITSNEGIQVAKQYRDAANTKVSMQSAAPVFNDMQDVVETTKDIKNKM